MAKFIKITRYIKWLPGIIPMIKKNEMLKMHINFQNLNTTTSKDKYLMPLVDMIVDLVAKKDLLSSTKKDMHKANSRFFKVIENI